MAQYDYSRTATPHVPLIKQHQEFKGATYGNPPTPMRCWDQHCGEYLWLYLESLGPLGIVRADTWETAYECVVDEIMDDADELSTWDAEEQERALKTGELREGCHYRSNGAPCNGQYHPTHALKTGIAQEDLNGSLLVPLTAELLKQHGITLLLGEVEEDSTNATT